MSHDDICMSHVDTDMSHVDTDMSHDDTDMSHDDTDDGVTETATRAPVGDSPIYLQVTWPSWALHLSLLQNNRHTKVYVESLIARLV
jgi:hypothetical protein